MSPEGDCGVLQRRADHRRDELEVTAGGHLGHDAAVACVQVGLRRDDRRQHNAVPVHDRGRGLVARRLYAEHELAHAPGG